jgi:murE/murF fusion protein
VYQTMLLGEALKKIPGIKWTGNPDTAISGIAYDSRTVRKGDLFVAIKGEKSDGARFIPQAINSGAAAVAAEQAIEIAAQAAILTVPDARQFLAQVSRIFYEDPSSKLKLVGITGTKGKTTTSYLMQSIFDQAKYRSCLAGTIEMKIGSRSHHSSHTTPESSDLMAFFRQALEAGCTHGALEVSSHSLILKRVLSAKFAVGVFMNLTHDHLDFHKDMESYFQAKRLFFTEENDSRLEAAVINTDDDHGKRLADSIHIPVLRFGFKPPADICVLDYQCNADGTHLLLATPAGEIRFNTRLIGRPNAYNIMAATGAALALGIPVDTIRGGVEALAGVPGRMELVEAGQDFTVLVDYAHSPDSLENLLQTVNQLPHKKLISVFGCGGDRDRAKRPIMGAIAGRSSDYVIATSDNPRTEDPLAILKEIEPGLRQGSAPYTIQPDRRSAIESAILMAQTGDVVVIAGKGHEDYQILGTKVIPFDDRKLAAEIIRHHLKIGAVPPVSLFPGSNAAQIPEPGNRETGGTAPIMSARYIESATGGTLVRGTGDTIFPGVSIDTRSLRSGDVFFAIRGPNQDGHRFIPNALDKGAAGVVVERTYACPADFPADLITVDDTHQALKDLAASARKDWHGTLVAVAGSMGKTTTRMFAAQVLQSKYSVYETPGNYNNLFGLPLALFGLNAGIDIGIFELGMSAPGEIAEMCRIAAPEIGILTNVAPVHLEFFNSVEEIAKAKGELAEALPSNGTLIFNADDRLVCHIASGFPGRKISFGFSKPADIRANNVTIAGAEETRFELCCDGVALPAILPFAGSHYVMNALPAVALARHFGISPDQIVESLARLQQGSMRGRILRFTEGFTVLDDSYNSNPRALMQMTDVLAGMPSFSRRVLVAGEMLELGKESDSLHFECGAYAATRKIDMVIGIRGAAKEIVRAARESGMQDSHARFFPDSEAAASFLNRELRRGDLVLVKGSRGVHTEKVVESLRASFALVSD